MNFAAILKALTLIPSLLTVIAAFVQQADTALAGVAGSSKLQSVLAAIYAYIGKIETDVNVVAELKTLVEPLIEAAVAFAHSPAVTAAATLTAAPAAAAPATTA
jgi:hypothetical protein